MKKLSILLFASMLFSCHQAGHGTWTPLFNGKDLTGWDTYLGPRYDSASRKLQGDPIGLNADPDHVFTVVTEDGAPAIRISGQDFGGISTTQEFHNYHLRLQFKWGTLRWIPKDSTLRDSGILYDAVGPHAADGEFWMRSQEFQVEEHDCGDYWGVAGAIVDASARKADSVDYIYDPDGEVMTFGDTKNAKNRHLIKGADGEKPTGQWNTVDLFCFDDTSVHVVNGVVAMILENSRQQDGDAITPLNKGKIQIQSEGAEIFYRNIQVEPIDGIPDSLSVSR